MAEDESANSCSGNPFEASGRDPFPSFEAALSIEQPTDEETGQQEGSELDWSIDTLAELKPVAFSPLPQQKEATDASRTPHEASRFFEDETQFNVLRTPLPTARQAIGSRAPLALAPSPSPPLELYRRCRDTIHRCEARLRERQRKMDKLQAVLPPPTPKRSPRQRATPPSRSTPPRPAKRNRPSASKTPNRAWKSPGMRPPKWSASPIAMTGSRQPFCVTPATLRFDAMTPSPLVNVPSSTTPGQGPKLRLSFGLSPITSPSSEKSGEDTLPLSSTDASESENGDHQQAQAEGGRQQAEASSSHADPSSDMMRPRRRSRDDSKPSWRRWRRRLSAVR